MPQRDDKIGVSFGKIPSERWEQMQPLPGAVTEKAIALLDQARRAGREVVYPASLKVGLSKKLWLTPETVRVIDRISEETGQRRTPIILAALDLYFSAARSGQGQAED
ncbi:hypothetical protein IGS68_34885 (plasmid) [Skermanella sp. TT6]|uniref:Ribbon-helix-helix CopG family protein n=1 Tax=Skermanella cutis TaxID=2775420 RepID=A0ABX7BHY5_9PROT|nr:hypothetical protein [Skermanella sp. TT6]QQP93967.1 hypothetical protein IGS68_34885 [Skermanella sp. TT6]